VSGITHKPAFWIAYALASLVALLIAVRLFPLAIPIVNLDVKMSRDEAIATARALAAKLNLAPEGARVAARFAHDAATQNYVELEGGGKPAFAALTKGDRYSPYWWEVRLFTLGTIAEAVVWLKPDGAPYGFARRLPETYLRDPARKALDATTARTVAEMRAAQDWAVDFSTYRLLEQAQQTQTSGRVDHTFTYERPDALGDARIRLLLVVSGDELTRVEPFVHVPEAFGRRFLELRSANNLIAALASVTAGVLYGIGGCILALLWLARRHWLVWRAPIVAGLVVGTLLALASLASAGTSWFGADTTETLTTFWSKQVALALLIAVAGGLAYGLVFMAAESLTRRAFPHHPQLWRLWSREGAASPQVAGRTVGGYLFVPIELALVATFYYATNRWLGWWQPSESLTDPNILGSAVPALSPIALSLQAGFMEECVFRAIPLSLAALVGARFGHRGLAIGIAVVAQALIFGGAHANYPGFPAYSRLVELVLPSILWALIFLRFGLVPTILLHATFDLALMAIPIFLVDAPGGHLQRALVIVAGVVPLALVLVRRVRAGAWREMTPALRNAAWQPATPAEPEPAPPRRASAAAIGGWIATFQRALPVLGLVGLVLYAVATPFRIDVPALRQDRASAIASADAALAAQGVVLPPSWRRMAVPKVPSEDPLQQQWHQFVWREAGADAYRKLVGTVLAPPGWDVRYARFDGDVADRAEEWRVTVNGDGSTRLVRHTLPEARPGAKLGAEDARALAEKAVRERLQLDPAQLNPIGAEDRQRPARVDWTFLYTDPRVDVGKGGEARAAVNLAGDEIASAGRLVHVPEEWQRAEREKEGRLTLVKVLLAALSAIVALAALVTAVLRWVHGACDRRTMIAVAAIAFVAAAIAVANRWPAMAINLSTSEPIASQAAIAILGSLLGGLLLALSAGLTAGVGAWAAQHQSASLLAGRLPAPAAGVAALLFSAGVSAAVEWFAPDSGPLVPSFAQESTALPMVAAALEGLRVLTMAGAALFVLDWLARLTAGFTRWRVPIVVLIIVVFSAGALVSGSRVIAALTGGAIDGLATAIVVYALLRFDYRAVPAYVAASVTLAALTTAAQKGSTDAWINSAVTVAVAAVSAWLVTRYLDRTRARFAAPVEIRSPG